MIEKLPKEWLKVKLGEISIKPQYGWTSSARKDGCLKLLRTTDISNGVVNWDNVPFCEKLPADVGKYLIEADDILVSRAGSIGISYMVKKNDLNHRSVFASYLIRFKPLIFISFINYFLKSHLYWDFIINSKAGIAVPNVNASKLQNLPIPLPPLNEQRRIAAKLDKIMPRLDGVNERLERIPKLIKRFRRSVLSAAVTGKLTEKWREKHSDVESAEALLDRLQKEREKIYKEECEKSRRERQRIPKAYAKHINKKINIGIPQCWETIPTSILFYFVTSGSRGWAKYYNEKGTIFLRITNLKYNTLDINLSSQDIKRVRIPQGVEGKRTKVETGDFLFSITGDVGMVAIVPSIIEESYVNQHIALARPINGFSRKFIGYFFLSPLGGLGQLKSLQKGATKAGLGLDDIVNVIAPLPPLEEQEEIVRQVDKLFALADKLEEHYKNAKEKLSKLPQSILAKAFRGQLVPQNPNDEPAHILLEKIKTEKERIESQSKKPNPKKKKNIKEV